MTQHKHPAFCNSALADFDQGFPSLYWLENRCDIEMSSARTQAMKRTLLLKPFAHPYRIRIHVNDIEFVV
jgi:hypothetical protein